MKILVTGGAGFVGRHLVRYLSELGNTITIFDNFSNSNKELISHLIGSRIKIIEGDITNLQDIENATIDQEIIIHLAAQISVEESIKNPEQTFKVNVDGTKNVLASCEKNNIKKLIAASSAAVYGEGIPQVKMNENSSLKPISPYGESKIQMEKDIEKFSSEKNLNYVILRFFNIFGLGQSQEYAGVITKFIERIDKSKSLEIFGDGNQIRDFVFIQDAVIAISQAIESCKNGTYNIASGNAISIKDLANLMIILSGKDIKINYRDAKAGDIRYSHADITLAKEELNYHPKYDINEIKNLMNL